MVDANWRRPLYLYTNPMLGKYLLEPLFQYQKSGQYPNKWSIHDMGQRAFDQPTGASDMLRVGAHYPQALGHNDGGDEAMPVEGESMYCSLGDGRLISQSESGNMLIMTLSYTHASGDMSLINNYVRLSFSRQRA